MPNRKFPPSQQQQVRVFSDRLLFCCLYIHYCTGEPWDWRAVELASSSQWDTVLGRVGLPNGPAGENSTVVQLLYSSVRSSDCVPHLHVCIDLPPQLYRAFLVPSNLTNENPYWDNTEPFFDSLFWRAFPCICIPDFVFMSIVQFMGYISYCPSTSLSP